MARATENKGRTVLLGFCNFYRRFIFAYLDLTIPLTRLTRKNIPWSFTDKCRNAFNSLKQEFTRAPVLTPWLPDNPMVLETDASDYALAAILSTFTPDGEIHPIAFHSRSFNPAELN